MFAFKKTREWVALTVGGWIVSSSTAWAEVSTAAAAPEVPSRATAILMALGLMTFVLILRFRRRSRFR